MRAIPVLLLAMAACQPLPEAPAPGPVAAASLRIQPASASAGVPRTIEVWGSGTDFRSEPLEVDFGDGVDAAVLIVDSSFHLRAQVLVRPWAEPGARDVTVSWGGMRRTLRNAFVVEEGSIALAPARAALGDTLELEITGWDTDFGASTQVSLGDLEIERVDVLSSSRLLATVVVPERALPGPRDLVVLQPGGEVYTLAGAFMVDRVRHHMRIAPAVALQGEELTVRVFGEGARWEPGATVLDLGTGVVVDGVTVLDGEHLEAALRVGNNAELGLRDVAVRAPLDSRILLDGFEIRGVPADPLRARVTLSFGISRLWEPDLCAFDTNVFAGATFYEPNDFPCPGSGASSTLAAPPHFDMVATGHTTQGGATDCPATKTFDAGPWVRFVGPENSVTLERLVATYTGRVTYRALGLDVADYRPDTAYALETPGGDLGYAELPAWWIDPALWTMPRDWQQHAPDYCGLQHPLDEPLALRWDPASTYDDAEMYATLSGAPQDEGTPVMMVYPWDDGAWDFPPEDLAFFSPGGAMLVQSSYRQTRFEVPGSEIANAGIGMSSILWRGEFYFLEDE